VYAKEPKSTAAEPNATLAEGIDEIFIKASAVKIK